MSEQRNSAYAYRKMRTRLLSAPGAACVVCGSTEQLELDHIIPHSKGGTDDESNQQIMCKYHNNLKSDKLGPMRAPYFNSRWLN
jgi:5-methylcytosine-specific restriction endonuclease McrA